MLQILILSSVAIFLFWRLSLILGTRSGYEKTSTSTSEIVTNNKEHNDIQSNEDEDISDYIDLESKSGRAFLEMKDFETDFTVNNFVSGAKMAYEIILMAFEKGDLNTLQQHLSEEVYNDFEKVVVDRFDKGFIVDAQFVGMREIRIKNAQFNKKNNEAEITMLFRSELTSVVRDKNNNVIEGNPDSIRKNSETWTFSRIMGSSDPSWKLIGTG